MILRVVVIDETANSLSMPKCKAMKKAPLRLQYRFGPAGLEVLEELGLHPGDVVLELGHGISTQALARWCHQRGMHVVNTHCAEWGILDDYVPLHEQVERLEAGVADCRGHGPTCILMHGMNPGLVSYCVKKAVLDLGRRLGMQSAQCCIETENTPNAQIAAVAEELNVQTVDITEVDTQEGTESSSSHSSPQFVSTW